MVKDKMEIYERLIDYCDKKGLYVQTYPGISEKRYDDIPMICANWNKKKLSRILNWGESYFEGLIQFDWDDEWTMCGECYKAVRTVPTHYGWTPSYMWASDCDVICHNHYEDYKDDIIEYYKNETNKAVNRDFFPILEKNGFVCYSPDEYCQKFETGFHPHQTDNPRKVVKDIEENLPGWDYIFKIDSVGQFDISWSVFLRKGDYNEG
ncbi:MAG: hypothetical protein WC516_09535 [Patescibacteria group bacterium]